jgi:hypothetical protein
LTATDDVFETALAELESGRLGAAYAEALRRAVVATVRRSNFPPRAGHHRWSSETVLETVADFAADPATKRRLNTLVSKAVDGRSFARMLTQAVKNFLRDELRDTDRAHAISRLRDVLENDDGFAPLQGVPGHWHLKGAQSGPTSATAAELVGAAFTVTGVEVRPGTGRRGEIASRDNLAALLRAVLTAAEGSVDEATLAGVIVTRRLGMALDPIVVELATAIAESHPEIELQPEISEAAQHVWSLLSETDRVQLAHSDLAVRALAAVTGQGKTAAATDRRRLVERLHDLLGTDPEGQLVYEALSQIAREWFAQRTREADSPFNDGTGGGQ